MTDWRHREVSDEQDEHVASLLFFPFLLDVFHIEEMDKKLLIAVGTLVIGVIVGVIANNSGHLTFITKRL